MSFLSVFVSVSPACRVLMGRPGIEAHCFLKRFFVRADQRWSAGHQNISYCHNNLCLPTNWPPGHNTKKSLSPVEHFLLMWHYVKVSHYPFTHWQDVTKASSDENTSNFCTLLRSLKKLFLTIHSKFWPILKNKKFKAPPYSVSVLIFIIIIWLGGGLLPKVSFVSTPPRHSLLLSPR